MYLSVSRFSQAVAVIACLGATALPALAADDSAELRIELQASMQRHIDRNLVNDAYLAVSYEDGALHRFFPSKAHTNILVGEGYYVLCADMRNAEGKSVPVDYYLVQARRGFRVIKAEIGNRKPLKALMKAGKLRKL